MEQSITLKLSNIKKSFYQVEVLHGVNLEIRSGEIHGLVGENGAGKSTLMNVIGGVFPSDSGLMEINGSAYKPVTPMDAQNAKIAFIHQELNLFSNLSIAENLFIDNLPVNRFGSVQYRRMHAEAKRYLKSFSISNVNPNRCVEDLSMGVKQSVEIIKALMKAPDIILFDEPTTSLSIKEKIQLFEIIRELKKNGISIIYISHILEDVFELCDRISVMRDGFVVSTKEKDQTDKDETVRLMVGRKLDNIYPTVEKTVGDVIFSGEHIFVGKAVCDVSFQVRAGEIVGVFGLMGAGRTELMRALFGLDEMDAGSILLNGKPLEKQTPQNAIAHNIAFITEDRHREGLLLPKPVEDNIILVTLDSITNALGMVSRPKASVCTDQAIKDLKIKVRNKKLQMASNLSGGNQQKVVIAKWLLNHPKVLIMDEPTRGIDVASKYEIYTIIQTLAKNGSAILFVSSEMEELMGICDRMLVMSNGRICGEVDHDTFDQQTIMNYALIGDQSHE